MLSITSGKELNKYVPDYVIFDLETTGISCAKDAVIEISAVKVRRGKVVDEFTTLVNPERPIPYYASQVNGITDDMVTDSPVFEEALAAFLEFAGDAVLVGHNIATFDMKFICRDANCYWGQMIGNDYVDTLRMAREVLPDMKHHKLTDLAEYYGLSVKGAHRALNDCRMNQQVFEYLAQDLAKMKAAGQEVKKLPSCPKCGKLLKKRNGKFGEFWGCTGFPNCRYTKNI